MSDFERIVCKPTRWFLLRAVVMLLMFGVFAVLFYRDGSTGYRKQNEVYYLHQAFEKACGEFAKMNGTNSLTPETWREHAAKQTVHFPDDAGLLPADLARPMKWPDILHQFDRVKPLQVNELWLDYTKERQMDSTPPHEPFDARKINEQWIVFWISSALALTALFFLIRTVRRSISVDGEALTDQRGRRVAFADLKVLDLRKWETKGLAFADYDGPSGKGRLRIDGLTYGGFKKDDGEPAEKLMAAIRARFSGEIIEYTVVPAADAATPAEPEAAAAATKDT